MAEEEKKIQETGGEEKRPDYREALEKEAARLEEYSKSPVNVDTQGQARPWDEFLKNKTAQSLVETPEQQAAREKRERTARRIAALSDGLVALSNVAGAMGGATPVKQAATMSAAHSKNVKEAMERRRLNARQYEIARQNAMKLQQKQDEGNAKRYDNEVAARKKAADKASAIRQGLGKQAQAQANADRTYELKKQAQAEAAEYRKKSLEIREYNAKHKGGGRSGKPTYDTIRTTKENMDGSKTVTTRHVPMGGQSKVKVKGSKKGGGYAGKFK